MPKPKWRYETGLLNSLQMIMTIKLIGVALEIAESRAATAEEDAATKRYKSVDPRPIDIFHYVFCHAGVLTGTSRVSHPIVREISSCFVLGVALPCLGNS